MAIPACGRPDLPFFACPKKARPKKGHPSSAPSAHPCAEGTRASVGVRGQCIPALSRTSPASLPAPLRADPRTPAAPQGPRQQRGLLPARAGARATARAKARATAKASSGSGSGSGSGSLADAAAILASTSSWLPLSPSPFVAASVAASASASASLLRAGARALPGAPGERRVAVDLPAGLAAGMRPRFSTGQGWPVRKPRPTHAYPLRTDALKGADEGWPFFWLLFFGHPKKSDSGSPKG